MRREWLRNRCLGRPAAAAASSRAFCTSSLLTRPAAAHLKSGLQASLPLEKYQAQLEDTVLTQVT